MDEKKDDEFVIDFSKLKNFFSRTQSRSSQTSKKEDPQENTSSDSEQDEEIIFNVDSLKKFFVNPKLQLLVWLLIPLLFGIYLRTVPASLPVTDMWGENVVYSNLKAQLGEQIDQKFPNLPELNRQTLLDAEFQKVLEANKDAFQQRIQDTSAYLKSKFTYPVADTEYVYLGDIDSYYWLRYARNIVEKGNYCDAKSSDGNGTCMDSYTIAPVQIPASVNLHPYAIVAVYKIFSFFNHSFPLMQASFYTPLFFALFAILCAFLIVRKITNNFGGFIAALLIAVNPMYLSRSLGSDTDVYTVFFPLVILLFFVEAFEEETKKRQIIYACCAAVFTYFFATFWEGWWYFLDLIIATLIGYGVYILVRGYYHHKKMGSIFHLPVFRRTCIILVSYLVVSGVLITVFLSWGAFMSVVSPLTFKPKEAANPTLWPNVLTTVAEFNAASLDEIIRNITGSTGIGSNIIFILAVLGIAFSFVDRKRITVHDLMYIMGCLVVALVLVSSWARTLPVITYLVIFALPLLGGIVLRLFDARDINIREGILITLWMMGSIYSSTFGVRFIMLLIPPFALSSGVALGYIFEIVSEWFHREFKISRIIMQVTVGILCLFAVLVPVKAGYDLAHAFSPTINDAWYDALTKINQNSSSDAIINSWWDFGHWFKYIADRRVTLDGSSQNNPPLHWLGKTLLTADEKQAVGILRMLDCGSTTVFDEINKKINFAPKTIHIINDIILLSKKDAEAYLKKWGFSDEEITIILEKTHCTPPEDYFITSSDMIGKAPVWAHFGSWDFTKAWMYYQLRNKDAATALAEMQSKVGVDKDTANKIYLQIQNLEGDAANAWISPWPSYYSNSVDCTMNDATIYCPNRIVYNTTINEGYVLTEKGNQPLSKMLYVAVNGTFMLKTYPLNVTFKNADREIGAVVYPANGGYKSLVMDADLTGSIFTRLFFLGGHGMSCFDLFDQQTEITNGGNIFVWKVDWNCATKNVVFEQTNISKTVKSSEKVTQKNESKH